MRLIFLLTVLLFSLALRAADRITLDIVITGTPADGNTLTVSGSTRTWKTTVATPSTQIQIGAAIGAHTTNLWNHILSYQFSPKDYIWVATNEVKIIGQVGATLTSSITGTWATLTSTTQTVSQASTVRVPITVETAAVQTNITSLLVSNVFNLGLSTEKILASSTVMDNFVDLTETQTVTGQKSFQNSAQQWSGGYLTNARADAIAIKYITNNAPLKFYNSSGTLKYGIADDANGIPSLYDISGTDNLATAGSFTAADENILNKKSADLRYGALGTANSWTGLNTFTLATGSTTNTSQGNLTTYGTTVMSSGLTFPRYDLTSLSAGGNADIPIGATNVYVRIPSGPLGNFTIDGIASGSNGRFLILENATGFAMTIANQSGSEATAANRIKTMSNADVTSTANVIATFIYDSSASRWKMMSWELGGGAGGGVTGLTVGVIPKSLTSTTLTDSLLSESGTNISANARFNINSLTVTNGATAGITTLTGTNATIVGSAGPIFEHTLTASTTNVLSGLLVDAGLSKWLTLRVIGNGTYTLSFSGQAVTWRNTQITTPKSGLTTYEFYCTSSTVEGWAFDDSQGGISGLTTGVIPYATSSTTLGDSPVSRASSTNISIGYGYYGGENGGASIGTATGIHFQVFGSSAYLPTDGAFAFASTSDPSTGSTSASIIHEGNEKLAVRKYGGTGAADNTFRIYGQYTNSTDYTRLTLESSSSSGLSTIKPEQQGSSAVTILRIYWTTGGTVFDAAGTGTPEGALSGGIGCTFRRTDGGAGTSFYVKESGTGNTGWVAK